MLYPDFKELVELGRKSFKGYKLPERPVTSSSSGDYSSKFRGRGLDFEEVRRYMPGDDIRNIDWRVTARTDIPHMKVFTEVRERTVILCVDASAEMRFGTRGTFKSIQAARAAAMLGWYANKNHDSVGALVFGDVPDGQQYFSPARSRKPLWKTLKLLSGKPVSNNAAKLEDALAHLYRVAPTGALIFVISSLDSISDNLEKALTRLHRRCEIILLRINDPADEKMPPVGMLSFVNNAGTKLRVNTDNRAGRDSYIKHWHETRQQTDKIAASQGINIIDLHTNKDIRTDLMLGLRRIGLRGAR